MAFWLGPPPAAAVLSRGGRSHLDVLLKLRLVLAGQLLVLPLELGDEDLPLDLLLLLQRQQLLLQLLLAHGGRHRALLAPRPPQRPGRLLARGGRLVVHAQVHGDGGRRQTQRQRRADVHCREEEQRMRSTQRSCSLCCFIHVK